MQSDGGMMSTHDAQQSIDYMVLDLNALRNELLETKNQFNSTKEDLE